MANYTKTITNSIRVSGPEPTEKWSSGACAAAMVWGSNNWLYGTVGLETVYTKGLANSVTLGGESYRKFTKTLPDTIATTSVVGKYATKFITNSVANTTTIGKNILHYYTNTVANTSAVGKDLTHYYVNTQEITGTIAPNMSWNRSFSNTISADIGMAVYKYRGGYEVVYGGETNVVNYPRGTSFTAVSKSALTWSAVTVSAITWS